MTHKTLALAACAGAAALALGTGAYAQSAPAAAAQPAINFGPPIKGICVFDFDRALGTSTVGKYVGTRLQQIGQQVNAELSGEDTALQNDAKALQGQRGTLDQNTLEQRAAALQVRQNALQRKAAQRERELGATQQQAIERVSTEMQPLVAQAAQAQACSIVLNRSGVVAVNPAMDLTPSVVTALNGKITQFTIERARLDQPAAAAGGAPPVTQTPGSTASRPAARK